MFLLYREDTFLMKKVLSIISIIAGGLILLSVVAPMILGLILKVQATGSVGIIGGADGPTAIMLVGVIETGSIIVEVAVGMLLVIAGTWGLKKSKKY